MNHELPDGPHLHIAERPATVSGQGMTPVHGSARKKPSESRVRNLALVFLLLVGVTSGFAGGWVGAKYGADEPITTTVEKQQVILKTQGQLLSQIAKNVGASVVSVNVTGQTTITDSFFGTQRQAEQQSAGTGIILSEDGLIMTNRHVVPSGSTSVSITLSDGTTYDDVTVVGRTSSKDVLDVAFLKVKDTKGKKLTAAKIGDSSKVQTGDSVVAIGNALGQFENTVTSGIISGYGRSLQASSSDGSDAENLENLFQTDAAINQGNSGGPLVNLEGEVIGINTAISGEGQGIGFAIPINDVTGLIKSVMDTGKLQRPYLGVMYVTVTDDLAKQYGLSVKRGAYIAPESILGSNPIISGGPADKAGMKPGDIITKVDDVSVDQTHSLTSLLGKHGVGDTVKLTVVRDGKERTVNVKLEAAPAN